MKCQRRELVEGLKVFFVQFYFHTGYFGFNMFQTKYMN